MGRPLKKKYFGDPNAFGKQLVLTSVWLEDSVAAESGYYVIRQVGTGRYQVTNGVKQGVVKLVDLLPDAPGEGVIEITVFGEEIREYAKKIHNRTVETFDGNRYKWSENPAEVAGEADLPFEVYLDVADTEDAIEAVNEASASAIVTLLQNDTDFVYLDSDDREKFLTTFTNGGGRQAAIGDGVAEIVTLFGEFETIAAARAAVQAQVQVEYNKSVVIKAVDAAKSAAELLAALKATVPTIVADRDALIREWSASELVAVKARAEVLKADDYTTVYKKLLDLIAAGADLKKFSTDVYTARQAISPSKKFNGFTRMITAIKDAFASMEA